MWNAGMEGGVAEEGLDGVVGLDLLGRIKSLAFILEAVEEPLNGLEEGSDIPVPFQKGHSSRRVSLLAGGGKTRSQGTKRVLLTSFQKLNDKGCAKSLGMERKGKKKYLVKIIDLIH